MQQLAVWCAIDKKIQLTAVKKNQIADTICGDFAPAQTLMCDYPDVIYGVLYAHTFTLAFVAVLLPALIRFIVMLVLSLHPTLTHLLRNTP